MNEQLMKKTTILCIDPGYSLLAAIGKFASGDFPGHCLYGVNHLENNRRTIILQPIKKGGRIKNEFKAISDCIKLNPDIVYMTFSDYGILLPVLSKLHIIKAPVIALFHGYHEKVIKKDGFKEKIKKIIRNWIRDLDLRCVDHAIFISKYSYLAYLQHKPVQKNVIYIPLQPEMVREKGNIPSDKYRLLSIGKTKREYNPMIECAKKDDRISATIISNTVTEDNNLRIKLTVIQRFISFSSILPYYDEAAIVVVPVEETGGGVYGLSSILDALAVRKPLLVSRTTGLGLDVDQLKIGRTYECGNSVSFHESLEEIVISYDEILNNIDNLVKQYNIESFAAELGKCIDTVCSEKIICNGYVRHNSVNEVNGFSRKAYWLPNVLTSLACYLTIPFRDKKLWVFACWSGVRYDDNSRYLYEYLLKKHPDITVVWISRSKELAEQLREKGYYAVWNRTIEGCNIMLRAGVAFYTNGLDDFSKVYLLHGAIIVHLGHAASAIKKSMFQKKVYELHPLKYSVKKIKDKLFNWYYFSYTIATSEESVRSKMLTYGIRNRNKVIVTGMPRNDIFKIKSINPSGVLLKGENLNDYKYILYMPTYRPYRNNIVKSFLDTVANDTAFNILLSHQYYKILVKLHNADQVSELPNMDYQNIIILRNGEISSTQELIAISDILITDYSSCCIDFALMNKPNILFAPDYELYCEENGIIDLWKEVYYSDKTVKNDSDLIVRVTEILNGNDSCMELTNWINEIYEDESIRKTLYSENIYQVIWNKLIG